MTNFNDCGCANNQCYTDANNGCGCNCNRRGYRAGFRDGYNQGYNNGYQDGCNACGNAGIMPLATAAVNDGCGCGDA